MKSSNESLDLLMEAERLAKVGTWAWDIAADKVYWSDELFRIFGMKRVDHLHYDTYLSIVHPDDRSAVMTIVDEAVREQKPCEFDHRILLGNGDVRIIRASAKVECDAAGNATRLVGVAHDITEQQVMIETLRRKELQLEEAQRLAHIGSWDWVPSAAEGTWSDELYRITGCDPATTPPTAESYEALIHPDDRAGYEQRRNAGIRDRKEDVFDEHRLVRPDGRVVHVVLQAKLQYDSAGAIVCGIGTVQDVTERKRMSRDMKLVLDSAAEGIFGMDAKGRINLANAAGARMLGWSVENLIGKNPHSLIHHTKDDGTPYLDEECPIRATIQSGVPQRRRDVFWRKDGASIPVEWAASPIVDDDGRIAGAVVTFSDITDRLAIDRMKDEFISTVSHELRTPLTSIRGSLGLLAAGRFGAFPEKAQRLLSIAVANTDRLVKLINDILDIEKLDSGKITLLPRPTVVAEALAHAVDGVRPLLERAQINVIVTAPHDVLCFDPDRIGQTLTNLLSNAIKFSPAGSMIRVSAERNGGAMLFSVRDQGRGIPADKLESIFERFQQVDASDSRDKGGSGLGLAICRSIVQQHGGEIWVESEPGIGSTFYFSVPAVAGSRAA